MPNQIWTSATGGPLQDMKLYDLRHLVKPFRFSFQANIKEIKVHSGRIKVKPVYKWLLERD
jgi:hypothetical protein